MNHEMQMLDSLRSYGGAYGANPDSSSTDMQNRLPRLDLAPNRDYAQFLKQLLSSFGVKGGGSETGIGGRMGFDRIPITDNVNASVGASGFYLPQQNIGKITGYDAALNANFGKDKQHSVNIGAKQLGTEYPSYFANYGYKF